MGKTTLEKDKEKSPASRLDSPNASGRSMAPPPLNLTASPQPVQMAQNEDIYEDLTDTVLPNRRYQPGKNLPADLISQRTAELTAALNAEPKFAQVMKDPKEKDNQDKIKVITSQIINIKKIGWDDALFNEYKNEFASAFRTQQSLPASVPATPPANAGGATVPGGGQQGTAKGSPATGQGTAKSRHFETVIRPAHFENRPYFFKYKVDRSDPTDIHLKVKVGLIGDPADIKAIKAQEKEIEKIFSTTKGVTLDLEFIKPVSQGELVVSAHKSIMRNGVKVRERIHSGNWGPNADVNAHELGHPLGLDDRYDHVGSGSRLDFQFNDRIFFLHKAVTDFNYDPSPGLMRDLWESQELLPEEVCKISGHDQTGKMDKCVDDRKKMP